ncbi:hypothetical protein [Natronococcus wangiae]|uniref:hypothetical protein n=1 Tax=Natronococcus wangiae TaxID=3068275 RepID=UPI00273F62D7|nr:hypothetical protein [Natronococcus sp. AD5]
MSTRSIDNDPDRPGGEDDHDRSRGDELYVMSGGTYVLCSVESPSTQWIEADSVADLEEWR